MTATQSHVANAFSDALEYLTLDGRRLAFRRWSPEGSDCSCPPLVLLHGLLDNSATFAPLVEALVGEMDDAQQSLPTIIAPDARGHGASDATPGGYWFPNYLADLDALLDHLAIDSAILVGHSMGGQVASLYAGARPERIEALVLLDSINVPDSDVEDTPERYREWLDTCREPPQAKTYADTKSLAERLAKRYPELDADQQQELAELWSCATDDGRVQLRADPAHRRRNAYGFRASEAKALWKAVTAPVLMIDGGDSPAKWFTPADEMAERRACFSDLTHIELDGLGHLLHWQAPARTAKAIADFLKKTGQIADS